MRRWRGPSSADWPCRSSSPCFWFQRCIWCLVNWRKDDSGEGKGWEDVGVWPVYALLKHLFFAEQVETGEGKKYLMADLGVLAALTAGDVGQAVRIGARRLQNAG